MITKRTLERITKDGEWFLRRYVILTEAILTKEAMTGKIGEDKPLAKHFEMEVDALYEASKDLSEALAELQKGEQDAIE